VVIYNKLPLFLMRRILTYCFKLHFTRVEDLIIMWSEVLASRSDILRININVYVKDLRGLLQLAPVYEIAYLNLVFKSTSGSVS
jgi:hypothetical protein